ncbi:hypothetical protein [Pseudomonas sp. URMO17WK12:I11]|uniref:hypothetical protein n=1 Tax=Pseudomonas sp. URMO17WK12:I11 TaxID=1283291 RepID=UPI0012E39D56|nr:hypothetical protein [Pseudomonas sp. URMO17WK12:I11]
MEDILKLITQVFGQNGLTIVAICVVVFIATTSIFKILDTYRQTFSTKHALEEKKLIEEIRKLQAERAVIIQKNKLDSITLFNPNDLRDLDIDTRPIHEKLSVSLINYGEPGKILLQGIITFLTTLGCTISITIFIVFLLLIYDGGQGALTFVTLFLLFSLGGVIVYYGAYIFGQHLMKVSMPRYIFCWSFSIFLIMTMLWMYISIIIPNVPI